MTSLNSCITYLRLLNIQIGLPVSLALFNIAVTISTICLPNNRLAAQPITLLYEDFAGYPDGTTAGNGWYAAGADCDDASPNEGLGISTFGVYGGQFVSNDIEGSPCCPAGGGGNESYIYFDEIDVQGYCNIVVEIHISTAGPLECDIFNPIIIGCQGSSPPDDWQDQAFCQIALDGGPWLPFTNSCFTQSGSGPGGGMNANFSYGISGHTTMKFRFSFTSNRDDEYWFFNLFKITTETGIITNFDSIPPLCEADPPLLLPTVSPQGVSGSWNVGSYFDPAGMGGDTVQIIFNPNPDQCATNDTLYIVVNPLIPYDLEGIGPFCSDDPAVPLQSEPNGISGTWSGPGVTNGNSFSPSLAGQGNHLLTYNPTAGICAEKKSINVVINPDGQPDLGTATLCDTDPILHLEDLEDPMFPNGIWSGLGVIGSNFNPTGLSGLVTLTYTFSAPCVEPATTTVFINTSTTIYLGSTTLCSLDAPFPLSLLNDPAYPNGTWFGPGVIGDHFDPNGLSGIVSLAFNPSASCVSPGFTEVTVIPATTPTLGTIALCEDDSPLNLSILTDPNFPTGIWNGYGVTSNNFNPVGQSGEVTLTFTPSQNCTLPATTSINVGQTGTPQLGTATICGGDSPLNLISLTDADYPNGTWSGPGVNNGSFDPNGQSGTVTISFSPAEICADAAQTTITVNETADFDLIAVEDCDFNAQTYTVTLEIGGGLEPYFVNGNPVANTTYTTPTIPSGTAYLLSVTDLNGCGEETLTGLVDCTCPTTSSSISQTLCTGSSLNVGGVIFNEANPTGSVTLPLANFYGCDSIIFVDLIFADVVSGTLFTMLCPGESLTVNGIVYDESNPSDTQIFPGGSAMGCDSALVISLSFATSDSTFVQLATCDPSQAGTFVQNLSNLEGCDSTVITMVNLVQSDTTLLFGTTCDIALAGTFVQNLSNALGCDSTVISNMIWVPSDSTFLFETSCHLASTGVFTQNLTNYAGCDSMVVTTVTFSESDTTLLTYTTCDAASAGVFTQNYVTPEGCDSMTITTVTLLQSPTTQLTHLTCNPSEAGIFTQVYTSANGCDSTVVVTMNYMPLDTIWLNGTTCESAQAGVVVQNLISANGCDSIVVTTVELQPSSTTTLMGNTCDPSLAGAFVHHYTNQYGCDSTVIETISLLQTDTTFIQLATCDATQVGTSLDVLQNQAGCDSLVVTSTSLLPISACSVDFTASGSTIPCGGTLGSISVIATAGEPPFNFEIWQNGVLVTTGTINLLGQTTTVSNLQAGDYNVELNSANGIFKTVNVTIGLQPTPQLAVQATSDFGGFGTSCQGNSDGSAEALALGGTSPFSFSWSNGALGSHATGLMAGNYTVTVTDASGCTAFAGVELTAPPALEIALTLNDPDCFDLNDGSISILANGGTVPYLFAINGGSFQASNTFGQLGAGSYLLTVMDANGCETSEIVLINAPIPINVELGDDLTIESGEGATLHALVNVPFESLANVTWTQLGSLECTDCLVQTVYPIVTTTYKLNVVGLNGCADDDEITVFVDRRKRVYVPNAFSPDGDGINDLFSIYAKPGTVEKIRSFLVFSRWGETVFRYVDFQPNDPAIGWDGTHRGEQMNAAVFVWFAEIEFKDGTVELFKGDVSLMR